MTIELQDTVKEVHWKHKYLRIISLKFTDTDYIGILNEYVPTDISNLVRTFIVSEIVHVYDHEQLGDIVFNCKIDLLIHEDHIVSNYTIGERTCGPYRSRGGFRNLETYIFTSSFNKKGIANCYLSAFKIFVKIPTLYKGEIKHINYTLIGMDKIKNLTLESGDYIESQFKYKTQDGKMRIYLNNYYPLGFINGTLYIKKR